MPSRTGKNRLMKLADMLDENASNKKGMRFDISQVGLIQNPEQGEPGVNCGTTGCAMGLAAISGKFKRAGLSYIVVDSTKIWTTMYGGVLDYDESAAELFDISLDEANILFSPWKYKQSMRRGARGERGVARRIRQLVEGKQITGLPEDGDTYWS